MPQAVEVEAGQLALRGVGHRALGVAREEPGEFTAADRDQRQLVLTGQCGQSGPVHRPVLDLDSAFRGEFQPVGVLESLVDRAGRF
ncbi:hypothetical protein [Phaeacidiphilus oryzae]|uniref:hypothetical protein n=1 Tax=Phaeacidiphilus oryzae TaxID=348818 RepID=UPI001F48B349|nr:hypothetical protein [Phaeacidiphilus oryzae]